MVAPPILSLHASALASTVEPAQALEAIVACDDLTEPQCAAFDYALSYWVLEALQRPADADGVLLLADLCAACTLRTPPDALAFRSALAAYRNLLENKRLAIAAPVQPGKLRHAERLLAWLARQGEVAQPRVVQFLQLSEGRVSQLLAALEAAGWVRRRRVGRENLVAPGPAAPPSAAARPARREAGPGPEAFSPVLELLGGGRRSA
jgi:DNA-binding transcriptional ArsR family regulator